MKLIGEHKEVAGQLVRYGLTGGLATVVNYGIFWVLAVNRLDPNLAWTVGYLGAVLVGYVVHSRWSFRGHGRRDNLARTGGRFFAVSLVSFALNQAWVWLLVSHFALPLWAPSPLVFGVTPLIIFSLNRRWVFA